MSAGDSALSVAIRQFARVAQPRLGYRAADAVAQRALITGITGQDGSYLAELLLEQGFEVHGCVRRVALEDPDARLRRLAAVLGRIQLHSASLENLASVTRLLREVEPDQCYHLAGQSFVQDSFQDEFTTFDVNIGGTHRLLSAIRDLGLRCRVYFAGSSEMFGNTSPAPQSEGTPFRPVSPYGISKLTGYHLVRYYREVHGLFACAGILFNHESPRRGLEFVTRKIARGAAAIRLGLQHELRLGNLEARRDWGYAKEYVRAMWLMLQREQPDDYVVATGRSASVRDLVQLAFERVDLDWRQHVVHDPAFERPRDVHDLRGDFGKARAELGWEPETSFDELVRILVDAELALLAGRNGGGR